MSKYTLLAGGERVRNNETNAYIPKDESNADYVDYLEWIEDGNTPDVEDAKPKVLASLLRRVDSLVEEQVNAFPHFINQRFDLAYAVYLVNKKVDGNLSQAEIADLDLLIAEFLKVKTVVERARDLRAELVEAEDPETVELEL